jgi:hypothetical protein
MRICQSWWPRRLRHRSAVAHLPGLRVRIPAGVRLSVFCECCVLCRYRSLRPADPSSREVLPSVVCLTVCDLETSTVRRPRPEWGCCTTKKIWGFKEMCVGINSSGIGFVLNLVTVDCFVRKLKRKEEWDRARPSWHVSVACLQTKHSLPLRQTRDVLLVQSWTK